MKLWKTFCGAVSVALLSGCASDLVTPPFEDHPNIKVAEMARARGDLPQAIHDFRDVIKECPTCERAYLGLGISLLDANAVPEAKLTFDKAIALFPQSPGAYTGLGFVYLVKDQPEEAVRSFGRALALNSRYTKAFNGYGVALDMLKDHKAAQANYRAAMELDPTNPSYESNLALSMILECREGEAIRILERLTRAPNATPRIRQNLALAYGMAGDMKMAQKLGRMDLPNDVVVNNIGYLEAIQQAKEYAGMIPKNHTVPLGETRMWQKGN
jgi:Flp pilus assembly protein TadD